MGIHSNIDFYKFPMQGEHGRVRVTFKYDLEHPISGIIVRNDHEDPFLTIIMLDDGRVVLDSECQYTFE